MCGVKCQRLVRAGKGIGTFSENVILPGGENWCCWIREGADMTARDL